MNPWRFGEIAESYNAHRAQYEIRIPQIGLLMAAVGTMSMRNPPCESENEPLRLAFDHRLQLHALAYNLANFMRTLALPKEVEHWSLTTPRKSW